MAPGTTGAQARRVGAGALAKKKMQTTPWKLKTIGLSAGGGPPFGPSSGGGGRLQNWAWKLAIKPPSEAPESGFLTVVEKRKSWRLPPWQGQIGTQLS